MGDLMSLARGISAVVCGRWTKWVVLAVWLVILGVAGPLAGKLTGVEKNDNSAWLPGSAESTKALALQKQFQTADTIPAVIVYERKSGITPDDLRKAQDDAKAFGASAAVTGKVIGPVPSDDKNALQVIVPITVSKDGWNKLADDVNHMRDITGNGQGGLAIHITGPGGIAADQAGAFKGIDGTLLYATLAVVVVILLLTYRSPVLWLLPVITAGTALTSSQAVIYLLAKHAGLTVNAQSAGILTVLVFGAATDYALLLIARYREELRRHEDRHEAMAVAYQRARPAIVASAATVVVAL